MAINYKFEEFLEDSKPEGVIMRFEEKYSVLEEFFFGEVRNFSSEIKGLLQKARLTGEKQEFSGNMSFIEAGKEKTVVGLLFGDEDTIRVNTQDLLALVVIYEETATKMAKAIKSSTSRQ